jgi:hypothetical protein
MLPSVEKLTLSILATITLQVAPFCSYAPFPALLPLFKCILEVVFREGVQHCLHFCLSYLSHFKVVGLFSVGKTGKLQGAK